MSSDGIAGRHSPVISFLRAQKKCLTVGSIKVKAALFRVEKQFYHGAANPVCAFQKDRIEGRAVTFQKSPDVASIIVQRSRKGIVTLPPSGKKFSLILEMFPDKLRRGKSSFQIISIFQLSCSFCKGGDSNSIPAGENFVVLMEFGAF